MRRQISLSGLALAATLGLALVLIITPVVSGQSAQERALKLLDQGELAAAAGKFDLARQRWQQALKLRPGWSVVKRRLAELPARQARFPGETQERERRSAARILFVEGVNHFNRGRYGIAQISFENYLKVFPDDAQARKYLEMARRYQAPRPPRVRVLPKPTTGTLLVRCKPAAQVSLNGQVKGRTPLKLSGLKPGRYQVEVKEKGARSEAQVQVQAGYNHEIDFTLSIGSAQITVNSTPLGQVFLDGKHMGETPIILTQIPWGSHVLEVRRSGYQTQKKTIQIKSDEKQEVDFQLQRR